MEANVSPSETVDSSILEETGTLSFFSLTHRGSVGELSGSDVGLPVDGAGTTGVDVFVSALGAIINFLNCVTKHNLYGEKSKVINFLSTFFASLILASICFTKPYRKMLVFFALSLAFDCIFKLLFKTREKKIVNKFQTNYVKIKDPNGVTKFRYVPPEYRKSIGKSNLS